jgi:hypothetical protein
VWRKVAIFLELVEQELGSLKQPSCLPHWQPTSSKYCVTMSGRLVGCLVVRGLEAMGMLKYMPGRFFANSSC